MGVLGPSPPSGSGRLLIDFFTRALDAFQHSASPFHVICTLGSPAPPLGRDAPPAPTPPAQRPRALVVLDSSFNPPTRAHLRLATSAILAHTGGPRLLLLLSVQNADKAPKPAAFAQRLAMMHAFALDVRAVLGEGQAAQGGITPSDAAAASTRHELPSIDIGLTTKPYFHEKSAVIAASRFYSPGNEGGEVEQVVLVGYDTVVRIFDPKYYGPVPPDGDGGEESPMQRELGPFLRRAKLRVTMRPGDEWGGVEEQKSGLDGLLRRDGMEGWAGRIELVEGRKEGEPVVSSTLARDAVKKGDLDGLGRMVTPGVETVIKEEGIYGE